MTADDEIARFVLGAVLGVVVYRVAEDRRTTPAPRPSKIVSAPSLPGGKGHAAGQRAGKRRTLS